MDLLKEYLWNEFKINNIAKYYKYFEDWYCNLTNSQIQYYNAYMKGFKTIH